MRGLYERVDGTYLRWWEFTWVMDTCRALAPPPDTDDPETLPNNPLSLPPVLPLPLPLPLQLPPPVPVPLP